MLADTCFRVVYSPAFVAFSWRQSQWQAICSGESEHAVRREVKARYGAHFVDSDFCAIMPFGIMPVGAPPERPAVFDQVPSYGRTVRYA